MEGARGPGPPPALLPGYATPDLHSANAVTRFTEEIGGPLRGGDPGVLLLAPGHATPPAEAFSTSDDGDGLWLLPLHDAFTGTETARASAPLAARAPAPRLLLHPADAASLGLVAGNAVRIDGQAIAVPVTLEPGLARGVVALSGVVRGTLRRVRVERAP
jgi:NADH-quinone oxidoreductase subunit G